MKERLQITIETLREIKEDCCASYKHCENCPYGLYKEDNDPICGIRCVIEDLRFNRSN